MRIKTDKILTLGMALTTDKKAMERRVRGVFARKTSAKSVIALSLALTFTIGIAAFTTACQPVQPIVSDSNAQLASGGNAVVSGSNALASGGNAAAAASGETKQQAMQQLSHTLERARKFPIPRMEDIVFTERGTWEILTKIDETERATAANQFLETANAIFSKTYTANDLTATYYTDKTGHRSDVWRFDSKDGVLSGALDAKTLAFLSADCLNEPADALHASVANGGKLDVSDAVERIATLLGGTVGEIDGRSGFNSEDPTNGWMVKRDVLVSLGEGRYCMICMFGDEKLTPTTVCVYPDEDCGNENVFWRADLEMAESVTTLLYPQDFHAGEPGKGDMARADAIAFYNKLVDAAGYTDPAASKTPAEPTATFYEDHSGARENYWCIEGNGIVLELTSKTGRMLSLTADGTLGSKLGLGDIPYEKMGEKEFEDATRTLFTALFGKDSVKAVDVNAVYDEHYCTMDPKMADGSEYEIQYRDGMIMEVSSFFKTDPSTWPSVPEWLKEYATVDAATGKTTIEGFPSDSGRIVPNWLADWVYKNNETGEIFAMEW